MSITSFSKPSDAEVLKTIKASGEFLEFIGKPSESKLIKCFDPKPPTETVKSLDGV